MVHGLNSSPDTRAQHPAVMGESTKERNKGPKEWNICNYNARSKGAKGCRTIADVVGDQLLLSIVARSRCNDPF